MRLTSVSEVLLLRVVDARMRLAHQAVDKGGLAVVQVTDQRHITYESRVVHHVGQVLHAVRRGRQGLLAQLELALLDRLDQRLVQRLRVFLLRHATGNSFLQELYRIN